MPQPVASFARAKTTFQEAQRDHPRAPRCRSGLGQHAKHRLKGTLIERGHPPTVCRFSRRFRHFAPRSAWPVLAGEKW